jgi:hypothetical protein
MAEKAACPRQRHVKGPAAAVRPAGEADEAQRDGDDLGYKDYLAHVFTSLALGYRA